MAAVATVSFTSCGDDDDDDSDGNTNSAVAYDNHAVDLGLPSGLKWSDQNLGANAPEGYGNYYAWGETFVKDIYSWENYKFGSSDALTKYVPKSSAISVGKDGFSDDKTVLERSDDAAVVNIGGQWRIATVEEWEELSDKCEWTWEIVNGIGGYRVKGPNGNSIFLPAAGGFNGNVVRFAEAGGIYWSTSVYVENPVNAQYFYFRSGSRYIGNSERYYGRSIRPVRN